MAQPRSLARRAVLPTSVGLAASAAGAVGLFVSGLSALTRPQLKIDAPPPAVRVSTSAPLAGPWPAHWPAQELAQGVETALDGHDTDGLALVELEGGDCDLDGWWGLRLPDARAVVGPVLADLGTAKRPRVVRLLHPVSGDPTQPGVGRLHPAPWASEDRWSAAGTRLQVEQKKVAGPVGSLPITEVTMPGQRPDRAVVYVHGRGASRYDGTWLAPTAAEAGWRTVLAGYRNDDDGPITGRYLLGGEWEDLAAVLDHLRADGVRHFVLVGWSMGGNICASYLRNVYAPDVEGLVLDAPALDWSAVLCHVARTRRLPARLVPGVMAAGRLLEGIDWRRLDHLADTSHLHLPVLLFHGTEDRVVPPSVSEHLDRRLPRSRLHLVEGAGHCRSVNLEPCRYLAAVGDFLERTNRSHAGPLASAPAAPEVDAAPAGPATSPAATRELATG